MDDEPLSRFTDTWRASSSVPLRVRHPASSVQRGLLLAPLVHRAMPFFGREWYGIPESISCTSDSSSEVSNVHSPLERNIATLSRSRVDMFSSRPRCIVIHAPISKVGSTLSSQSPGEYLSTLSKPHARPVFRYQTETFDLDLWSPASRRPVEPANFN